MSNARQLVGNAGVYHVARELSRHSWNVLLTVRNARGADLYAISQSERLVVPIQVKAHTAKPNDIELGLNPERFVTPWWVVVAFAATTEPVSYVVSLADILELKVRDPGIRSGKPEDQRKWWFSRHYFTPGNVRELTDARDAWHRLGDPAS
jgi:hypothetical protein